MKISPVQPWSRLSGSSVMLVEVIESCSMEELATKEGGSINGLRSLDLEVFCCSIFFVSRNHSNFLRSIEVVNVKEECSCTLGKYVILLSSFTSRLNLNHAFD